MVIILQGSHIGCRIHSNQTGAVMAYVFYSCTKTNSPRGVGMIATTAIVTSLLTCF